MDGVGRSSGGEEVCDRPGRWNQLLRDEEDSLLALDLAVASEKPRECSRPLFKPWKNS